MFEFIIVLSILIFLFVTVIVLFTLYKIISTIIKDKNSPIESIHAKIVSKRTNTSNFNNDITTWYYVTFEFNLKERKEFQVNAQDYGILVEGDEGVLTYQGTSFKSFERK